MAGTRLPGFPDGAPYDDGLDRDDLDTPQTLSPNNDDSYLLGTTRDVPTNYLICDWSGVRVRVSEGLKRTWNNLRVREKDWDARHLQDFVRVRPEVEQRGSERPEQDDVFLATNEVDPTTFP